MSVMVVDASVAAKWFFQEAYTADAVRVLDERHRLHAPDLLPIETASVVCKRVRRGEISEDEGRRVRTALAQFPIRLHDSLTLLDPAFEMAARTGCSIYDGLYVSLAALLGGRMVTADRRLCDRLAKGPFAEAVLWVGDVA